MARGKTKKKPAKVEAVAPVVPSAFPALPERVKVFVGVVTYSGMVHCDVMGWVSALHMKLAGHPRLHETEGVVVGKVTGYPTDRARNLCVKTAKDNGFDFAVMVDDDMCPDLGLMNPQYKDTEAVPFLPSALDFALAQPTPCVVGAPYCGGPPDQRVMVMRWREKVPDLPPDIGGMSLESYTREEAAVERGFVRVAGLPTGCMLVDLRCLDSIPPPWFSYEWADPPWNTKLASTEDIVFTRNAHWLGIPQWAAFSSWAGHNKTYLTGKPRISPLDGLPQSIYKAAKSGKWDFKNLD